MTRVEGRLNVFVMAFAREDIDELAVDPINQSVGVIDSAAPESAQIAF